MSRYGGRGINIGPNGETFNPTLVAPASINTEEDCKALREAMKGLGTDEDALIKILGHRTLEQRMQIHSEYKSLFGKDLIDKLHGELSGNFRSVMKMLLMEWPYIKARALFKAMKGAGTKESVIVEILCSANNAEIEKIKDAYLEVLTSEGVKDASRNLESDLKDDLSGCFRNLVIALVQGERDELSEEEVERLLSRGPRGIINMKLVEQDAEELYDAGAGQLGTDEATFIRILARRNVWHLQAVNEYYEQQHGKSLMDAIESETSGDFREALQLTLFTCLNRQRAYANMLRKSMEGLGTKDDTLMRIIVTRCEIDLGDISRAFEAEVGKSLEEWIRGDTSGDYRKILLTLLGIPDA